MDNSPEHEIDVSDGLETVQTPQVAEADGLEHLRIEVRRVLESRRLDKYLSGRLGKDVSRTSLQQYIREGNVTVNDQIVKPRYTIRAGDVIDLMLPVVKPREIPPEPIPLDIIYEDDDILAINKQADIIVHPARGKWTGTLVNGLAYYFRKNWRDGCPLPTSGEIFRPGIVHRLDRDTTGIMLVAKTELALWRLGWQFEHRKIRKTYNAIVHGLVSLDGDVIDVPIGKHYRVRHKYAVSHDTGKPFPAMTKSSVTRYKVLQRIKCERSARSEKAAAFTLMELSPKTGRTHQLRVHMSYIGHPIVADKMYGGGPLYLSSLDGLTDRAEGPLITRQALHAAVIKFSHPRTNQDMELQAPWPADFTETLNELQSRSRSV